MGRKKKEKLPPVKVTKQKSINCANCHLSCPPSNISLFTEALPNPPKPNTSSKKRKLSKNHAGDTHVPEEVEPLPATIKNALETVFFIYLPEQSQHPKLGLCPDCAVVLSQAWIAVTKFRQVALDAPTSFLAPYLQTFKEEVETEPSFDPEAFLLNGRNEAEAEHDDPDPLAMCDLEDDAIGDPDYIDCVDVNHDIVKREAVFDPNRVLQIQLEPLTSVSSENIRSCSKLRLKLKSTPNSEKDTVRRKLRKRKRSPSPSTLEKNREKAEKLIAREELKTRREKLSKLRQKFLEGRKEDTLIRAGRKRFRKSSVKKRTKTIPIPFKPGEGFSCELCGKEFRTQKYLDDHLNLTHKKSWPCSRCGESFAFRPNYFQHIKDVHSGPATCAICNKNLKSPATYKRHMIFVHKSRQTWDCDNCKRAFILHESFLEHQARGNCARNLKVNGEPLAWSGKKKRNENYKKKPKSTERNHVCTICQKAFIQGRNLKEHMTYHFDDRPFKCPEPDCEKAFKNTKTLNKHKTEVHMGKPLMCSYPRCGVRFGTRSILRRHEMTHVGREKKEFGCHLCPKFFKRETGLNLHIINIHEMKHLYPCSQCSKSFATNKLLATHMLVHRPPSLVCDTCGHMFKHAKDLTHHQLSVHIGEEGMPHKCPSCPRRFVRKELARIHMARYKHFPEDQDPEKNSEETKVQDQTINVPDGEDGSAEDQNSGKAELVQVDQVSMFFVPEGSDSNMNEFVDSDGVFHGFARPGTSNFKFVE